MKYILKLITLLILLSGCGSDNSVDPPVNQDSSYSRILTAESGEARVEVWSSTGNSLTYGYNNIGFKVYRNGIEMTSGFVEYKPTMYHGLGGPSHSVPVRDLFYYDSADKLFKGYAVFIMYDETAFWAADYNYNNELRIDSSAFSITYNSANKIIAWDNVLTQRTYVLSLISPLSPRVGQNDMNLMLHETSDFQTYGEIDSAEMFIRPWMESMGHGSSNNVNPVYTGGGTYKGNVNFNMAGEWFVYDSINYRGNVITKTPPPKLNFDVY